MVSLLRKQFESLSLRSVEAVQDGVHLSDFDRYMHVKRPIEDKLRKKMQAVDAIGGGIILLIGSAGDGKSHLISQMKREFNWSDESYYNDATASCSPKKSAIETLKEALVDFKDKNIHSTNKKLVLAINLGKLNAFIDEPDVKSEYSLIEAATRPIFDKDYGTHLEERERVKLVLFSNEQIFEFYPENKAVYPVGSNFISQILSKVVDNTAENPFYRAYKEDLNNGIAKYDPVVLNYELLMLSSVRKTIELLLIEAIVRYKLLITPREFLDFLYSILVHSNLDEKQSINEDFFEVLLPSLLYGGGKSMMLSAMSNLDPLKYSSIEHDKQLAVLFTSHAIPHDYLGNAFESLPKELIERTNALYSNNGRDLTRTAKFVYRLKHLLNYHSECNDYVRYLSWMRSAFSEPYEAMSEIDELVSIAIPRHFASYYRKANMIPLPAQGGKYRLFGNLYMELEEIQGDSFDVNNRSAFSLQFNLKWKTEKECYILMLDYQLYAYLRDLQRGKLSISYENEKHIGFSTFLRKVSGSCDSSTSITIVRCDSKEFALCEKYKNIILQ